MSSLSPSIFGESVTFTATVTNGADPVTTGTVEFTDGATSLGAPVPLDANGQATLTTSALATGTHTITATYSGTAELATSTGSVVQVVTDADTTTALTSSANPSIFGEAVTFTATVTVTNGPSAGPADAGTVTFTDGATPLGVPVPVNGSGQATLTTSSLTVGTHTVTATYGGATGLGVSEGSVPQVVSNADSATVLTSSLDPSNFGTTGDVHRDVTITRVRNAGPATTGSVTFADGGTNLGTVALDASGQAALTTSTARRRHPPITATYSGATGIAESSVGSTSTSTGWPMPAGLRDHRR